MKTKMKKFLVLFVTMVMLMMSSMTVFASSGSAKNRDAADIKLMTSILQGCGGTGENFSTKTYTIDGGGKATWDMLLDKDSPGTGYINETNFKALKASAKSEFINDLMTIADDTIDDPANVGEDSVTPETKKSWLDNVQKCDGVGSQLMTTLLANTKPDYVTANRIYQPFSGVVGTCLGLGAILMMAFIAITMVLDLMYIGIPAFRMFCDPSTGNGGGGQSDKPKFISYEAISSIKMAEEGDGSSGQNGGTNKVAVGIYFKKRVIMLLLLGICLLYLVSGNIFTLVGWMLDLVSGFLGF